MLHGMKTGLTGVRPMDLKVESSQAKLYSKAPGKNVFLSQGSKLYFINLIYLNSLNNFVNNFTLLIFLKD